MCTVPFSQPISCTSVPLGSVRSFQKSTCPKPCSLYLLNLFGFLAPGWLENVGTAADFTLRYCTTFLETEALKNFQKMLKAFTDVMTSLENGIKVTFNGSLLECGGGLLNTVTGGLEL